MQHYLNQTRHAPGVYDPERYEHVQAFIPKPDEIFSLPVNVTKAKALNIASEAILMLGGNSTDVAVLRKIADTTDRVSWHSPIKSPVNWRKQCDMASELNIGERHFRSTEKRLEQFGVLARETADNGYRGRRSGQKYGTPISCGLSLEPLIANHHAHTLVTTAGQEMKEQRQAHVLNIRKVKNRVRTLTEAIADIETRRWAENAYEELKGTFPRKSMRVLDEANLDKIYTSIVDLENRIREALTPLDAKPTASPRQTGQDNAAEPQPAGNSTGTRVDLGESPVTITGKQQEFSAAPDLKDRCHIQPRSESLESCNEQSSSISTPADAGDRNSFDCREKKWGHPSDWINPSILEKLNPTTLNHLASEDAASYLNGFKDWRDALPHMLQDLSVNVSAWLDAVEVLGEFVALIALIIIDRNRFHPVYPIKSPGGALRKFTRLAKAGELNLTRSIIGIWDRDRKGTQPRAKQQNNPATPTLDSQSHAQPMGDFNNQPCYAQNTAESLPANANARNQPESSNECDSTSDWINPAILEKLTPDAIRRIASEDVALYLEACDNWKDALPHILQEINVNSFTWQNAVTVLGEFAAFIALIVIDRRRFDPHNPVTFPGAALENYFQNARRGKLDLSQAIIDIWESELLGELPRAYPGKKKVQ